MTKTGLLPRANDSGIQMKAPRPIKRVGAETKVSIAKGLLFWEEYQQSY
jgi:hypothetical protein